MVLLTLFITLAIGFTIYIVFDRYFNTTKLTIPKEIDVAGKIVHTRDFLEFLVSDDSLSSKNIHADDVLLVDPTFPESLDPGRIIIVKTKQPLCRVYVATATREDIAEGHFPDFTFELNQAFADYPESAAFLITKAYVPNLSSEQVFVYPVSAFVGRAYFVVSMNNL